jgi:nitroreductase
MDLYPTIFRRKSVRKYKANPLNLETINKIESQIKDLKPFYEDIKTEFMILSHEEVNQRMMKKAPHYIAAFSAVKEGYLTNLGYMLQQMELYLSQKGLGACWQGIPTVRKTVRERTDLRFVILMAFGDADEQLYRSDVSEFKRKSYNEISSNQEAREIIEAARLAPSATNSQSWFFTGDKTVIHAYMVHSGLIKRLIAGKYPPIDIGIALYHLTVAAEHFGYKFSLVEDEEARKHSPENMEYVISLKLI